MPTGENSEVITGLISECEHQAEKPPIVNGEPDRYISMFAVALKNCLDDPDEFLEAKSKLSWAIDTKKESQPFPSSYVFNHIMRIVQMVSTHDPDNLHTHNLSYPFKTQAEWDDQVFSIMSDEEGFKKIAFFMLIWNVGSDIETRAAGPKLVAHTMQKNRVDSPEEPFTMLNVGSARDHTLVMLAENVEFSEVRVDDLGLEVKQHEFLQKTVNKLLAKDIDLSYSCGVDMWPLRDPEWSRYLEACRFYPSEFHDPKKRFMYGYLEALRDDSTNIDHVTGKYGEDNLDFGQKFSMVVFLTSMYQNYQDMRRGMFDCAESDLEDYTESEEGKIIVVQDFCEMQDGSFDHPMDQLIFSGPVSKPYTYGTFVYDTSKPELGFQEFARWNNGRCEIIRPGKLLIELCSQK